MLQISWTHALRKIVINCYKFHGREDLLPAFSEEDEKANQLATLNSSVASTHVSDAELPVVVNNTFATMNENIFDNVCLKSQIN